MTETKRSKVTLGYLYDKMRKGEPLTMLTCYDYPMADLVEKAGSDIVLVGDSMGMTILGYDSTLPRVNADCLCLSSENPLNEQSAPRVGIN